MAKGKIYGMLGLARRSGSLALGAGAAADAVRHGRAKLIVIASDCSDNTKKRLCDKGAYYKAEYIVFGGCDELGRATGTANCAAAAVTDMNFAKSIKDIYNNLTEVAENGSC